MKKLFFVLLLTLFSRVLLAPGYMTLVIPETPPVNIYERLMEAIVQLESSGDTWSFNFKEQACGPFQIRPCRMEDYNRRSGSHYKTWDAFDYNISRKIFLYYTAGRDYETVARSWNGSGPMTIEYWKQLKTILQSRRGL